MKKKKNVIKLDQQFVFINLYIYIYIYIYIQR